MNTLDPAAADFIERMGLSLEGDGLPRIAGRMWGFFIINGGPCSFADLAQRLQVSRGSVSTNARLLRSLGILQRVARPGDRQDYYQLAENPYESLLSGYIERVNGTCANAETALKQLPPSYKQAKQRLRDMHDFYSTVSLRTQELVDDMRQKSRQHARKAS
ncbi:MAG: GbsR/MarR family transcriptional regulator [Oceanococcus sp.]